MEAVVTAHTSISFTGEYGEKDDDFEKSTYKVFYSKTYIF